MLNTRPGNRRWRAWAPVALFAATFLAGHAEAQCAGDCNHDNRVAINELIIGVNIASGSQPVSVCASFDRNGSNAVEINELVGAVNNALSGCPPPGDTATPTATATEPSPIDTPTTQPSASATPTATGPGDTPTPTATATTGTPPPPNCGDGTVNLDEGETCDDNNTDEGVGDVCPADCHVEPCNLSGQRFTVEVVFNTTDPELLLGGLTVFIPYPDGTATVPGTAGDAAVIGSVSSDVFAVTPNDQEYSLVLLMIDPLSIGYGSGTTAASATFEICTGAALPPLSAFQCIVTDAIDLNFTTVTEQVSCSLSLG
jgi:hypothetical protein